MRTAVWGLARCRCLLEFCAVRARPSSGTAASSSSPTVGEVSRCPVVPLFPRLRRTRPIRRQALTPGFVSWSTILLSIFALVDPAWATAAARLLGPEPRTCIRRSCPELRLRLEGVAMTDIGQAVKGIRTGDLVRLENHTARVYRVLWSLSDVDGGELRKPAPQPAPPPEKRPGAVRSWPGNVGYRPDSCRNTLQGLDLSPRVLMRRGFRPPRADRRPGKALSGRPSFRPEDLAPGQGPRGCARRSGCARPRRTPSDRPSREYALTTRRAPRWRMLHQPVEPPPPALLVEVVDAEVVLARRGRRPCP